MLDTLVQIHAMAVDFIKCKDKYGSLVPDDDVYDSINTLRKDADEWTWNRFPDVMQFLKKPRAQHSMSLIQSLPKRLKWAAFYKDKYEKLINRFRELNDALIDLVDSEARVAIRQSTQETNTVILHLHNKIDELAQLFNALLPDTDPSSPALSMAALQHTGSSNTQQRRELANLTCFKAVNTLVEDNTYFKPGFQAVEGRQLQDFKLAKSDIHLLSSLQSNSERSDAEYQSMGRPSQRVWIEWRDYDPIARAQPDLYPSRIDKLVALLSDSKNPELLRVPHCVGYFDDSRCAENNYRKGRLGFVFELPTPTAGSPVSLMQLLKAKPKPMLTLRIDLAKAISKCLMSLHSVNWLHKGLRSHNILFFPEDGKIDYSCPFLSGFGYARPTFREDMTEIPSQNPEYDMYRHPRTHGLGPWEGRQGFKRTFDIYSLGIVLIEIANWQSISEVLHVEYPNDLDDKALAGIQRKLLDDSSYLDTVGTNTGRRFRDATMCCLDSAAALEVGHLDDETDVHVAAKLSQNFYHQVLRPLEEIQT